MAETPVLSFPPPSIHDEALVAGVDEAGRGPWAGPVVAGAVILDPANVPVGLADSKVLSEAQRERLFDAITARATAYATGIATVEEIDELNILQATMLAMRRAVAALGTPPRLALIDGNRCPALTMPSRAIVDGDAHVPVISAASIVAKVVRDRMMRDLDAQHPGYGWVRNKGYGTVAHRAALLTYGPSAHHRRSFRPIAQMLCAQESVTPQIAH
jgi:ribonuclease HII